MVKIFKILLVDFKKCLRLIYFSLLMTIINEEKKYRELNESIRRIKSQRNDTEKNNLIEKGKRIRINEAIKRNEIINNSLKP